MTEDEEADQPDVGLTDELGRPLRLFLIDGRPVTDSNGVPLLNIVGNPLITFHFKKNAKNYCDMKGTLLTDRFGRTAEDADYSPTECPPDPEQKRLCNGPVFALDGHPLTDPNGLPLVNANGKTLIVFNAKGHPVTDLEGRDVTDSKGVVLYPNERPYLSKDNAPLRIFDEIGRPLTDENGFPLTDILGSPLIVNDDFRNPTRTLKGYPLKDADGLLLWNDGFDLTKVPKYNKIHKAIICENKEHGIAFDKYGHPLTDMYGFPLFDLEGVPLVKRVKKSWLDVRREPVTIIQKSVYDKDTLKNLRNSKSTAVRVYDRRGYPLTDHQGTPLMNASGLMLLQFKESGEPFSDAWGFPIYDSRGNSSQSDDFRPCKDFKVNPAMEYASKAPKRGTQCYDVTGMPITNLQGIPLLSMHQELMAEYDDNYIPHRDLYGRDVYDVSGLPVNSSLHRPLKGPNGAPIRLYNKSGRPLTDKYGNILLSVKNSPSIRKNCLGMIVSDSKGCLLYDADGCPMNLLDKFLPTKYPPNEIWGKSIHNFDGMPLVIYDMTGSPLTDARGGVLMDSFGKSLITVSQTGMIQEKNGEFILDTDGYSNLKIAGRAVKDKIAIYDEYDRPLIGHTGYILRLRSGKEIVRLDKFGYPVSTFDGGKVFDSNGRPVFTPLSDMSVVPKFETVLVSGGKIQLFDCEDRPLLDINGLLLYTSKGVSFIQFNKDGEPRSDAHGRPIYDSNGIPVCKPGGVWRDQYGNPFRLYDSNGYPLTDQRGKELLDINCRPLIRQDAFGHPMYTVEGEEVCDMNGRHITSPNFLGTTHPPQSKASSLMESKCVPLRLFDLTGRPMTDECGKPLETSKGKPIVDITKGCRFITDLKGHKVYDSRKLPLGCDSVSPILTMDGKPVILYSKYGNPLMTSEGVPIKRVDGTTLLSFDQYGRPIDSDDSGLYDMYGNSVGSPDCTLTGIPTMKMSLMSLEGRPVKVFDAMGLPLTDDKGNVLYRSDGEPLKAGSWGDNLG